MALTSQEKEIARNLKAEGKTSSEIAGYIGGLRLKRDSSVSESQYNELKEKESSLLGRIISDIPSDIAETGRGISEAIQTGREEASDIVGRVTPDIETGIAKTSPLAGTAQTIGAGLKAGARAVGETVLGLGKLFTPESTEQKISETVQTGAERLAQTEPVQNLLERYQSLSPEEQRNVDALLGTAEGLGTILGAGPATQAVKKGLGATSDVVTGAIKTGTKRIDDLASEIKTIGITAPSTQGISQAVDLGLNPNDIMQRVARVSKGKQAAFEQRAGESIGSYLVSRDIFGTPDEIVDQLYKRMKDSMSRVDTGLSKVKGTYKDPSLLRALRELQERETRVGGLGTKSPDTARINELLKKHGGEGLSLSEANEVKRLYERNVKLDFLRDNVASGVEASNRVDNAMREFIVNKAAENGFDTVTALNKETSLAKQLLDDIGAEYAGQAGNNAIGLSDTIFLAEATGNPIAAAGFIAKKVLGSKGIMSKAAKALSKDAGSKAELPQVKVEQDTQKLKGYLQFLQNQSNEASP